jgi:membrane-bound metal-dependent hydrolase YbcI (DUF457 family)
LFKRHQYICDSTRFKMYALGHFALGYLAGKGTSKLAHVKLNLPILLAVSVIPDVDLIFSNVMNHRGLTHSIIVIIALMIPLLILYRKTLLPYAAALISHVFIGDFFTGGIEFLWPITKEAYGFDFAVNSLLISVLELLLFFVSIILMYRMKDLQTLFKPIKYSIFLIVPFVAIIGPLVLFGKLGDSMSLLLVIPSLFWLGVLAYSMLKNLVHTVKSKISSKF